MLQEDFRCPIACISPDFVTRRRKSHPGPIRALKKRYCTVFSEFPGFWVHRKFRPFSNRPITALFGKRRPVYRITSFPDLYSPEWDFLRLIPSLDRRIRGYLVGGGRAGLSPQILVSPARIPDCRIFVWDRGLVWHQLAVAVRLCRGTGLLISDAFFF
jgi:hypothetical protein